MKYFLAACVVVLGFTSIVIADFDIRHWNHQKSIEGNIKPGMCQFSLDEEVYLRLYGNPEERSLKSLRIIERPGMAEVPFVLKYRPRESSLETLTVKRFNESQLPGKYRQLDLKLSQPLPHNSLQLESPGTEYRRRVDILGSDDGRSWVELLNHGYVLRVPEPASINETRVSYPESRFPFLRVRLYPDPELDDSLPKITKIEIRSHQRASEVGVRIAARQVYRKDKDGITEIVLDTGTPDLPLSKIILDIETKGFVRKTEIHLSNNPPIGRLAQGDLTSEQKKRLKPWTRSVNSCLYRIPHSKGVREKLALPLGSGAQFIRIRIHNYDDTPLKINSVTVQALFPSVFFEARSERNYILYLGNPQANQAVYDMTRSQKYSVNEEEAARLTLSQLTKNAKYSVSETNSKDGNFWFLWTAVLMATAFLAYLLFKMWKTMEQEEDGV